LSSLISAGIAERIVADLGRALGEARDDPAGDWKLLARSGIDPAPEQSASVGSTDTSR